MIQPLALDSVHSFIAEEAPQRLCWHPLSPLHDGFATSTLQFSLPVTKIYYANASRLFHYFYATSLFKNEVIEYKLQCHIGAGRENRTPVLSLATICSTTKLYPQKLQ